MPKRKKVPNTITVTYADGTTETKRPKDYRGGGGPKTHRGHRATRYWKDLRRRARKRDEYQCVACGSLLYLNCHHLTYVRVGKERLEDVATLCRPCHRIEHDWWVRLGAPWERKPKIAMYLVPSWPIPGREVPADQGDDAPEAGEPRVSTDTQEPLSGRVEHDDDEHANGKPRNVFENRSHADLDSGAG